jgi:23S rRNA (adenine2030-N6)-methyltransferase
MANHHFGKFGDVWKHLVLAEVLALERPSCYAETHAGSGSYAMVDDPERRFGVLHFLDVADATASLRNSRYRALLSQFGDARRIYPGSALMAMAELGVGTRYLFCDLDVVSVGDLRVWSTRLGIPRCEVVQADGMMTVLAWLEARVDPTTAGRVVAPRHSTSPPGRRTRETALSIGIATTRRTSGSGPTTRSAR